MKGSVVADNTRDRAKLAMSTGGVTRRRHYVSRWEESKREIAELFRIFLIHLYPDLYVIIMSHLDSHLR